MNNVKSLSFLASQEVYYSCYQIIEHIVHSAFWYCLCDRYQGCLREESLLSYCSQTLGADYCCICWTLNHYKLKGLNEIKCSFYQEKFYLHLLRDLAGILSVDPEACFWEDEFCYKYRNYREGTESQTCLRDIIDFYLRKKMTNCIFFECSFTLLV